MRRLLFLRMDAESVTTAQYTVIKQILSMFKAAIATVKRQYGSARGLTFIIVYQTAIAWLTAFYVNLIGMLVWE